MTESMILRLDFSAVTFIRSFSKLPVEIQREARKVLGELVLRNTTDLPDKLHFHNLKNSLVPSIENPKVNVKSYTIHISAGDGYKASFTLEDGTAYMRFADKHDRIDKKP